MIMKSVSSHNPVPSFLIFTVTFATCPPRTGIPAQLLGEHLYSSISEPEFRSTLPAFQALFGVRFPILFLTPPLCPLEFLLTRETRLTHTVIQPPSASYQTSTNLEVGDLLILMCNLPTPQNPYVKAWWGIQIT